MVVGLALAILSLAPSSTYSAEPLAIKASLHESHVFMGFDKSGKGLIRQYRPMTKYYTQAKAGLVYELQPPTGHNAGTGLFLSQDRVITAVQKDQSGRTVVTEHADQDWRQISPPSLVYCDRVYRSSQGTTVAIGKKKASDGFSVFHYENGKETNLTLQLRKNLMCFGVLEDGTVILAEGKRLFSWRSGKQIELGLSPDYMASITLDRSTGDIFFEPARGLPESEGQPCLVLRNGRLEKIMGPGERALQNVKSSGSLIVGEEPPERAGGLPRAVVINDGRPQYLDDVVANISQLRSAGFQGKFASVSAVGSDGRIVASGPVTLKGGSGYQIYILNPEP